MAWYMRLYYWLLISPLVFLAIIGAAHGNAWGWWTPLLNYLDRGWQSYAVVFAVSFAGFAAYDVISEMSKKKQDPS